MSVYYCQECQQHKDNDYCCCSDVNNKLVCEDCIKDLLLIENEKQHHIIFQKIDKSSKLTKSKKNRLKSNLVFLNEKIQEYISEGSINYKDIEFTYKLLF